MILAGEFLRAMGGAASVVAVSPHPDDVALSCGGLLLEMRPLADVALLTVFSASRWMLGADLEPISAEAVTARRQREEQCYADLLGARLVMLDAADSSLRGYDADSECADHALDERLACQVETSLAESLDRIRPDLVLGPAAIGGHVDHRLVSDGLLSLSKTRDWSLVLYEDLPYAASTPNRKGRGFRSDCVVKVSIAAAINLKIELLRTYASQIDDATCRRVRAHACRTQGEIVERFLIEKARNPG